jgi:hypothetical protein
MGKFCIYILSFALFFPVLAETNPWTLPIFQRIITRKNVSHIVLENRTDHYRITLHVSDRYPYNYKSRSYFLFIRFNNAGDAQLKILELDKFLESGEEIKIYLNGNEIIRHEFLKRNNS